MHEAEPIKGLKEREICPVEGCSGDARYAPPGGGHMQGCYFPYESRETMEAVANRPVFLPEVVSEPSQESKIIISLLMRIYDVQMALLTKADPETADKLYDAHERGEDFNPTIYIPEIKDDL